MSQLLEKFYNPDGTLKMSVSQVDENSAKLSFTVPNGSATLSWHQARDLYTELHVWLMDVAHLSAKEN